MDDDFWNTSSHSGFNFEEDEILPAEDLNNSAFSTLNGVSSELPIHAIISKACLNLILDDVKSTMPRVVDSPEETIKKMLLGINPNFHNYVKFSDKRCLLEKAIESCDGNVILSVILYLKGSLKPNLFYLLLSKNKSAIDHYANYLFSKNDIDELINLHSFTGNNQFMKLICQWLEKGSGNKTALLDKIERLCSSAKINEPQNKQECSELIELTEFQLKNKLSGSVITTFADLCNKEMSNNEGLSNLRLFQKTYKIDNDTFDWVLLNVLASLKLWAKIVDIFIKNSRFTNKQTINSELSAELFLIGLNRHKPPKTLLENLLKCLSDSEKAFMLATKLQCHNYIIQYYITRKDRQCLIQYRDKVEAQSSDYFLIEGALKSSDNWKN
ncbi:spermatogenesis-defective protein 39 homolog [Anthonomus grandis grandis]|uniref:spermatogenesis-defective protein 39 homolog n=1 Tax=Anthonomus grandis grandis TaxID=2921223 RepID=UPI0021667347|nr:spermatogenesis-defective protein 39 homolog [Anthonomus grandis grandis]XP_050307790.1 spermatogenesis-defective protein 39 homolog [Anthonomus grandis grandis]